MEKKKTNLKRRILFSSIAFTLIISVIAVYETRKEMEKTSNHIVRNTIESTYGHLRSYYRSHKLPTGWEVANLAMSLPDTIIVQIVFLPRMEHSQHGKTANKREISRLNACPTRESQLNLINYRILIDVQDKSGQINSFTCSL